MRETETSACEVQRESMQVKRAPMWSELTTDNKIAVLRDTVCELLIENSRLKTKVHDLTYHSHADGRPVIPIGLHHETFGDIQWQLERLQK